MMSIYYYRYTQTHDYTPNGEDFDIASILFEVWQVYQIELFVLIILSGHWTQQTSREIYKNFIFYKEVTHHKLKVLQLRVSEMFNSTNQNKEPKVIDQSKVRTI